MTVTPLLAKQWMEKDFQGNRKPNKDVVGYYADAMRRGQWQLNGDTIKFDTEGFLLDGQHRLLACIAANTPFDTFVTYGIDRSTYPTQNSCYKAKTADRLRYNMIKNPNAATAILSSYIKMKKGYFSSVGNISSKITDMDVLICYDAHKEMVNIISAKYNSWQGKTKILPSSVACSFVMYCVLERNYNLDFMIDYIDKLLDFRYVSNETIVNTREFLRKIFENKDTTTKWLREPKNMRLILVYSFKKWITSCTVKSFSTLTNAIRSGEAGDVNSIPYCNNLIF